MNGQTSHRDLLHKISRLVEERGWSRKEFAQRAGLSPQTVQHLFRGDRRLRNKSLHDCAQALGLRSCS